MGKSVHQTHCERVVEPRLLNLHQLAAYIGVSYWTARDYVLQGLIPTVPLPPGSPREGARPARQPLKRILVDRRDADHVIDSWKGGQR